MNEKFSLKDHLFNSDSLGDLAREFAAGVPGFDADAFLAEVLPGLQGRELLERLEWIADCIEARLSDDFMVMADQLEAAMPPELDPAQSDDDFGRFIHAVPGILAVRHGMRAEHRQRSMDLLHAATRRFSMEFYIRPFINEWPDETFDVLASWASDPNYHVRRLVSEGTRPRLPWAKAIKTDPLRPLPLLDQIHADSTRYVTRSVANHLNDISKIDAEKVLELLVKWQKERRQTQKELNWMCRHSLRTSVKNGHSEAMAFLGYQKDAKLEVKTFRPVHKRVRIGEKLTFEVSLFAQKRTPVIVDYLIEFHKPNKIGRAKVFKLKQAEIPENSQLNLTKSHLMKGNASTFQLVPGPHKLILQVNGKQLAETVFELVAGSAS